MKCHIAKNHNHLKYVNLQKDAQKLSEETIYYIGLTLHEVGK